MLLIFSSEFQDLSKNLKHSPSTISFSSTTGLRKVGLSENLFKNGVNVGVSVTWLVKCIPHIKRDMGSISSLVLVPSSTLSLSWFLSN